MKVLVLGAGVIGVSSAWYLAKAGHEVRVVDRQSCVADETSYGNAGMLSYGYANPWAAPGVPIKAIKWMLQALAPIAVSPSSLDTNTFRWLFKMLLQCTKSAYHHNKNQLLTITEYSRHCMDRLNEELALDFDYREQGTIELFRNRRKMASIRQDLQSLEECGIEHELIDHDTCIAFEPALQQVAEKFVGGLRFPEDCTGDCRRFTRALAKACEQQGVIFDLGTEIESLEVRDGEIQSVLTGKGALQADSYVVSMGSYSPILVKPLGIDLPVYPIKGYSLTLPIVDDSKAPQSTVMDEAYKVAVTRFDDRIRVGGTAEIAAYDLRLRPTRRRPAEFVVSDLFPGAGDLSQAEFWCGLRPMTPTSLPYIGQTKIQNLFLNTGHGTLGWTMSQGSGQLLADIVSGKQPEIVIGNSYQ